MVASALASSLGRRVAGRSAAASSAARARFGRSLVSALDSVRTVKLAAATPSVHAHLQRGRRRPGRRGRPRAPGPGAARRRARSSWSSAASSPRGPACVAGGWGLATALLVAGAVSGFDWFGRVAGAVVTEAPGVRAWMQATSALAGGGDLMTCRRGVDLVTGAAPAPAPAAREPLRDAGASRRLTAIHDDGTVGVSDVDLTVSRRASSCCCSGRSARASPACSSALAGLVSSTGAIRWNDRELTDPEIDPAARPGRPRRPGAAGAVGHLRRQRPPRPPRPRGRPRARDGPAGSRRRRGGRAGRARRAPRRPALRRPGAAARPGPGAGLPTPSCCSPTTSPPPSTRPPRSSCGQALRASAAPPSSAPPARRAALAQADRVVVLVDGGVVDRDRGASSWAGGATWRGDAPFRSLPVRVRRGVRGRWPRPLRGAGCGGAGSPRR